MIIFLYSKTKNSTKKALTDTENCPFYLTLIRLCVYISCQDSCSADVSRQVAVFQGVNVPHLSYEVDLSQGCRRAVPGYFTSAVTFRVFCGSLQWILPSRDPFI